MFEVIIAGMVWDTYTTYQEAIEVALTLGFGARVRQYATA